MDIFANCQVLFFFYKINFKSVILNISYAFLWLYCYQHLCFYKSFTSVNSQCQKSCLWARTGFHWLPEKSEGRVSIQGKQEAVFFLQALHLSITLLFSILTPFYKGRLFLTPPLVPRDLGLSRGWRQLPPACCRSRRCAVCTCQHHIQ